MKLKQGAYAPCFFASKPACLTFGLICRNFEGREGQRVYPVLGLTEIEILGG